MYQLETNDINNNPTIELYSGTGLERKAAYFINGFMADVYAGLEPHDFPEDTAVYIVHFERVNSIYDLAIELKDYLDVHSKFYDSIKIIGFSAGSIILQRLQKICDFSAYEDKLTTIAIAPITINYFDILTKFSLVQVQKIKEKTAMRIFARMSWYGDFEKADFEVIRRQMLFILDDNCFKEQLLGSVDIAILPGSDKICFNSDEAQEIAKNLLSTKGNHDVRSLPLPKIFGNLAALNNSPKMLPN